VQKGFVRLAAADGVLKQDDSSLQALSPRGTIDVFGFVTK